MSIVDKLKDYIIIVLVTLLIFQILPKRFSNFIFLTMVSILTVIYICLKYGFKNYRINKKFIIKVIEVSIIVLLLAFIKTNYKIIYYNRNKILEKLIKNKIIILVIVLCFISYYLLKVKRNTEIINKNQKLPILIKERKYDLNRLKVYLSDENISIIGLNGNFGTGKSLIIEYLKKDLKEDFYIIEIDLLSSNLDNIQIILMNEIDKVLRNYGIFSRYSPKLRSFFSGHNLLRNIESGFFYDDTIFINMIRGIKHEITLLDKPLLIVYEDLDRINNFQVIQKILGISEKLSSKNLKIIYQYSKNNLEGIVKSELGNSELSNNYLEKYIPININLTSIELLDMIKFQLEINKKYNRYITSDLMINLIYCHKDFKIKDYSGSVKIKFKPHLINMRRVERFLGSIYTYIKNNTDEGEQDFLVQIATIFYLIEYFIPEVYTNIAENKDLEDIFKFKYKDEYYSLSELYNYDNDELDLIFDNDFNKLNIWILTSLGYELSNNYIDPKRIQEQIDLNMKINKRFKNIYSAGILKYTNYENYAKKFIEEVLNFDENSWEVRYNSFNREIVKEDEFNIFYMGVNEVISIFKSFNIINASQRDWLNLFNFFRLNGKFQFIDRDMFEAFLYVDLNDIKVNIEVGKIINDAKIIGNLNDDQYFKLFLKRYYRNWYGLSAFQGIELIEHTKIDLKTEDGQNEIISILKGHINILEKRDDAIISLTEILDNECELELNIKVTNKLIEIITDKEKVKTSRIVTKVSSSKSEEIKTLNTLKKEGKLKEFKSKAKEYYSKNKIVKAQLKYLLKETNDNK